MSSLLAVSNVSYGYPGHPVLDSLTFSADGGEFLVLMGVNGAGKSTLLDIIAGLRTPDSGEVLVQGNPLQKLAPRERSRRISHLPQGTRNDLPFTVEQVVLMGRYAYADRWFESDEDRSYAEDAMKRMDCLQFRERFYSTLSGGEQQRVLLAKLLLRRLKAQRSPVRRPEKRGGWSGPTLLRVQTTARRRGQTAYSKLAEFD